MSGIFRGLGAVTHLGKTTPASLAHGCIQQNAGILAALKEGAKITPMGALRRFGCFRLSARIADIRKMGYKVKTRIVSRNRKNYAEYYLEA